MTARIRTISAATSAGGRPGVAASTAMPSAGSALAGSFTSRPSTSAPQLVPVRAARAAAGEQQVRRAPGTERGEVVEAQPFHVADALQHRGVQLDVVARRTEHKRIGVRRHEREPLAPGRGQRVGEHPGRARYSPALVPSSSMVAAGELAGDRAGPGAGRAAG